MRRHRYAPRFRPQARSGSRSEKPPGSNGCERPQPRQTIGICWHPDGRILGFPRAKRDCGHWRRAEAQRRAVLASAPSPPGHSGPRALLRLGRAEGEAWPLTTTPSWVPLVRGNGRATELAETSVSTGLLAASLQAPGARVWREARLSPPRHEGRELSAEQGRQRVPRAPCRRVKTGLCRLSLCGPGGRATGERFTGASRCPRR